jgi:hypothetical protein
MKHAIGPHFWFVDAGIFHWEPHGEVQIEQAEQLLAQCLVQLEREKIFLGIFDARDVAPLSAAARGLVVDGARKHSPRMAVGFFGASLVIRSVQTLALRAAALLSGSPIHFRHFRSEAEALAYVREQEPLLRELRGQPAAPGG